MGLAAGDRIGVYEVVVAIGAGGMGEVCRARDTKLNREVAPKTLPEAVGADPDRRSRFLREAQVLAALKHPNIAHIHGSEDAGAIHAIVTELVDVPTLGERSPPPGMVNGNPTGRDETERRVIVNWTSELTGRR